MGKDGVSGDAVGEGRAVGREQGLNAEAGMGGSALQAQEAAAHHMPRHQRSTQPTTPTSREHPPEGLEDLLAAVALAHLGGHHLQGGGWWVLVVAGGPGLA